MGLKNIAISESNYEILKNLGKAGESFNDVLSQLIMRMHPVEHSRLNDSDQKLRSEERPRNHTQMAASSANSHT
jgi:predicted CopG family antitoxin